MGTGINKVVLDLDEYNRLKYYYDSTKNQFESVLRNPNGYNFIVYSNDDAVKKLLEINNNLDFELAKTKGENTKLKQENLSLRTYQSNVEADRTMFLYMSSREFRKWKRNNKNK